MWEMTIHDDPPMSMRRSERVTMPMSKRRSERVTMSTSRVNVGEGHQFVNSATLLLRAATRSRCAPFPSTSSRSLGAVGLLNLSIRLRIP